MNLAESAPNVQLARITTQVSKSLLSPLQSSCPQPMYEVKDTKIVEDAKTRSSNEHRVYNIGSENLCPKSNVFDLDCTSSTSRMIVQTEPWMIASYDEGQNMTRS